MDSINYKIEVFEGPMDLLLYLISKHKLNIYDIPIVELVNQYTEYIHLMEEENLDISSDFLEMAARLVYIKTLSLLPVHEEGEQLRRELSGELIEYAECKRVAVALSEKTDGFNCIERPMEQFDRDMSYNRIHEPMELLSAYLNAVGRRLRKMPPSFESFKPLVTKKIVSVSYKIKRITAFLKNKGRHRISELIMMSESRSDMVAAFLAILELAKTKHIYIEGDGNDFSVELIKMPEGELDFD